MIEVRDGKNNRRVVMTSCPFCGADLSPESGSTGCGSKRVAHLLKCDDAPREVQT